MDKTGVQDMLREVRAQILKAHEASKSIKEEAATQALPVIRLKDSDSWKVEKIKDEFVVIGRKIERFGLRADFEPHSVARLRDIMKKMGIMHGLERQGIEPGDKIIIQGSTLDY